ncbi:MAG TPA: ATP-binding protein [Nevskiaceae bacterium]|nr:ATP-binding protein [Nevskiaceae bacterium]
MTATAAIDSRPQQRQDATQEPLRRQLMRYSQFLYRAVFALLLFHYMRHQGINPGFLSSDQIAGAMVIYVLATLLVMLGTPGARLTPLRQRLLVLFDLGALVVGVPHDPNPGLPTLFVFYLAYADLGLRYQFRLYVEYLLIGVAACALMVWLRAFHTEQGFTVPDWWQVMLLAIIVLHGLQVVAGRDRSRQLIRETQDRLKLALQSEGLGAWSTRDPFNELKMDGHIQQVLGLDRASHFSERMADYLQCIHPEDRPRVIERYGEFVRSPATDYEDSYRVVRPSGEVRSISSRAKAVRDAEGHALSISGMVWDLTEQRRQQEALVRMEERYRLATVSAQVAVWIWHCQEDRFEHDYATNHLLRLPPEARAQKLADVLAILHPEDREAFEQRLRATLASGAREFFDEVRVLPRGARHAVMQCRATIYRDEQGQATRLAGASWDATRLAAAREELERSNRELDDFSYIASHDLKEPLRGIASYAQYLQQDYAGQLDERGRGMLQRIRDQAARMEELIRELLHIARLGRSQLVREPVALEALLEDILESLRFCLEERQVQIRRPQPLPEHSCDRVRTGELLRNLLTNAAKYNDKPQRWIEIGWREDGPARVFWVRDNGIGIAPEYQARVFTLFERLHKREAYGGGTGVGLTIAQKIVQLHGGRIWLESEPDQGTTFFFTLPEPVSA